VPAVSKLQKVGGRGGHVEFVARGLRLVDETGGYEGGGVGIVGFVEVDGIRGNGDEGTFGNVRSIGEREGFTDDASHAYCMEKRW